MLKILNALIVAILTTVNPAAADERFAMPPPAAGGIFSSNNYTLGLDLSSDGSAELLELLPFFGELRRRNTTLTRETGCTDDLKKYCEKQRLMFKNGRPKWQLLGTSDTSYAYYGQDAIGIFHKNLSYIAVTRQAEQNAKLRGNWLLTARRLTRESTNRNEKVRFVETPYPRNLDWSNFGGVAQRHERAGQQSFSTRSRKNECMHVSIAAGHPTVFLVGSIENSMCEVKFFGELAFDLTHAVSWVVNSSARDAYRIE